MGYSFTTLGQADAPEIARLQYKSWAEVYADVLATDYVTDGLEVDIKKHWSNWDTDKFVIGARDGQGTLVGFAAYIWREPVYLDNFHVAKACHGSGVAGDLFRKGLAEITARDGRALYLTVLAENSRARRFYRKMGGEERAAIFDDMLGKQVKAIPVHWDDLPVDQKNRI